MNEATPICSRPSCGRPAKYAGGECGPHGAWRKRPMPKDMGFGRPLVPFDYVPPADPAPYLTMRDGEDD
jgi:hypothetical protein